METKTKLILNFLEISYEAGVGFTTAFGKGIDVHDVTRKIRERIEFSPSQSKVIAQYGDGIREKITKVSFTEFIDFANNDSAMGYSRRYKHHEVKDTLISQLIGQNVPKQGVKIITKGGSIGFHYTNEPTEAQRLKLESVITAAIAEIAEIGDTAPFFYILGDDMVYLFNKNGGFIKGERIFDPRTGQRFEFVRHEDELIESSAGYGDCHFIPKFPGVYETRGSGSWFMKPKGGFSGVYQHDYKFYKIGDIL